VFYTIVKILVLPPASFFVLFVFGLLLRRWAPRLGRAYLWSLLVVVYLSTTPFAAGELMAPLQPYGPVDLRHTDPEVEAIVVLGAGVYFCAPEYRPPAADAAAEDIAGGLTLQRLQYAAFLAKATDKPILVSGGPSGRMLGHSVAEAMRRTLERDFGVQVRWTEDVSRSTQANAQLTATQLRSAGVRKFYLVTHAWHMPRAMISFEGTGLEAVPAPTRFVSRSEMFWRDFLPSANAFGTTYYAVHEWLGIAWYRLRG
jgi:uncharacterized SAM-binding protein YcdF (DUF218 family)